MFFFLIFQVLTGSLSLQQVNYEEPTNFYFGPRAVSTKVLKNSELYYWSERNFSISLTNKFLWKADLIHLGAKFAPCMRRDKKINAEIQAVLDKEKHSACCIRNDESGCIQALEGECSVSLSDELRTWQKYRLFFFNKAPNRWKPI